MLDRYYRNLLRCKRESSMKRALMVIAVTQVIFCNHHANGLQETVLERPPYLNSTPISEKYTTLATIATPASGTMATCTTQECYHAASLILSNMDRNVEPCDNFYKFACGGFVGSTIKREENSAVSTPKIVLEKVTNQLRNILEAGNAANEPKIFRSVKNFYKSCMNETAIEARGLAPLREKLKELGGWPVVVGDSWNENDFDWKSLTYKFRDAGFSFNYLIDLRVDADMMNGLTHVLQLDQAKLVLSHEHLEQGYADQIVSAYYKYMVDVATMLGANKDSATEELKESLNFEKKLADISSPVEIPLYKGQMYEQFLLSGLIKKYPSVPWIEYFTRLLPPTNILSEDEVIIVHVPSYFSDLLELIDETKPRVLANYLMWRATMESVKYLNDEIRKKELNYSFVLSLPTGKSRWQICFEDVTDSFVTILGSMYVTQHFDKKSKKSAATIATNIHEQFIETIKNSTWLDDETRTKVLAKAEAMGFYIAYSEEQLDTKRLENIYGKLELSEDNYFENAFKTFHFLTDYEHSHLGKPKSASLWDTNSGVTDVNAYYNPITNSIIIPAAILQEVFFNNDRPKYMNYGAIGAIVAHEIIHAVVDPVRQLDKDGEKIDWWTLEATKNYLKRAQCIIDQYGNYTVEGVGIKLDGYKTQMENMADNGGIKVAYRAYKKWVEENGPEPGLPGIKMNPQQLFWVSSANMWCTEWTQHSLERVIEMDNHAINEFRILGPFRNSEEFSKDFHCPKGSGMNPTKKCSVW